MFASFRIKDERRLSVRLRIDLEPAAADSGRRMCEPVFLLSWVLITAKVTRASLVQVKEARGNRKTHREREEERKGNGRERERERGRETAGEKDRARIYTEQLTDAFLRRTADPLRRTL